MYHAHMEEPNTVAVDLVGPLPRFSNGHIWILVWDTFTKWITARPLRQAVAVEECVILQQGCPKRVITDSNS